MAMVINHANVTVGYVVQFRPVYRVISHETSSSLVIGNLPAFHPILAQAHELPLLKGPHRT